MASSHLFIPYMEKSSLKQMERDARDIPLEWIVDEYVKNAASSSTPKRPQEVIKDEYEEQEFTSTVTTTFTTPTSISYHHHSKKILDLFPFLHSDRTGLVGLSSFTLENMGLVLVSSFILISMLVTKPLLKLHKKELPKLSTLFRPNPKYGLRLCKQLLDEHHEMDREKFVKKIQRGFPEIRFFSLTSKERMYRSFGAVFDLVRLVSRDDVENENILKMLANSRVTNTKILHLFILTTILFELAQNPAFLLMVLRKSSSRLNRICRFSVFNHILYKQLACLSRDAKLALLAVALSDDRTALLFPSYRIVGHKLQKQTRENLWLHIDMKEILKGEITVQTVQKLQFLHHTSLPRLNFLVLVSFVEYWGDIQNAVNISSKQKNLLMTIVSSSQTEYSLRTHKQWSNLYRLEDPGENDIVMQELRLMTGVSSDMVLDAVSLLPSNLQRLLFQEVAEMSKQTSTKCLVRTEQGPQLYVHHIWKLFPFDQKKKPTIQQLAMGLHQLAKIFQQCRELMGSCMNFSPSVVNFVLDRVLLLEEQDKVDKIKLKFDIPCLQTGHCLFHSILTVQVSIDQVECE